MLSELVSAYVHVASPITHRMSTVDPGDTEAMLSELFSASAETKVISDEMRFMITQPSQKRWQLQVKQPPPVPVHLFRMIYTCVSAFLLHALPSPFLFHCFPVAYSTLAFAVCLLLHPPPRCESLQLLRSRRVWSSSHSLFLGVPSQEPTRSVLLSFVVFNYTAPQYSFTLQ